MSDAKRDGDWLAQPDGPGWWFCHTDSEGISAENLAMHRGSLVAMDGSHLDNFLAGAKWQRIPSPAEIAALRECAAALRIIAECGGTYPDTPEGMACTGSWCAEQARSALARLDAARLTP